MKFANWFLQMREPSWYILTRCALLACVMLCSAVVVLLLAGGVSVTTSVLHSYAQYTATMAAVVLGAGLLGSALMEDMLGYLGQ